MYEEKKRRKFQFSFLTLFLGISIVSLVGTALCIDGISTFGIIGAGEYLGAKTSGENIVPVLGVTSGNDTQINALSGEAVVLAAGKTPVSVVDTNGITFPNAGAQPIYPAASVLTPATNLTPTAGARLSSMRSAIATAAPTAVYVFVRPTLSVGKSQSVYNQGASPLQIVPEDGAVNATGALTPFACTTQKECTCKGYSTTQMICTAQ